MKKHYVVDITVQGATPPRGRPIKEITFIIPSESEEEAMKKALEYANKQQKEHPRRYKNAIFSVSKENVKLFF